MKQENVLINVARGEIVDEDALGDALERDHVRGAALDVYVGEFEHTPTARLWSVSQGADHAAYLGGQRSGPPPRCRSLLRKSTRLSHR